MLVGPRTGVPRTIGQVAPTQLAQEDPRTVGPKDYWALGLLAQSTLEPKDYWAAPVRPSIRSTLRLLCASLGFRYSAICITLGMQWALPHPPPHHLE